MEWVRLMEWVRPTDGVTDGVRWEQVGTGGWEQVGTGGWEQVGTKLCLLIVGCWFIN